MSEHRESRKESTLNAEDLERMADAMLKGLPVRLSATARDVQDAAEVAFERLRTEPLVTDEMIERAARVLHGNWAHQDQRLTPDQRLWWLAEELRNTADAIGPAPDLAEQALRSHASVLDGIVTELRGAAVEAPDA